MTVRIWVSHGESWVKIRVGKDPVHIDEGGPWDEGYSYSRDTYHVDFGILYLETASTARDCDGRFDSFTELRVPIIDGRPAFKLASADDEYAPPDRRRIQWERFNSSQRDYSAEAMGY